MESNPRFVLKSQSMQCAQEMVRFAQALMCYLRKKKLRSNVLNIKENITYEVFYLLLRGSLMELELLRRSNGKWFKYLFPIEEQSKIKNGMFALTPWCFYMHGIRGVFELPKHMYTSFTLMLNQGERLIIVPDYRINEVFIDGGFIENRTLGGTSIIKSEVKSIKQGIKINLQENDQVILIRDCFFGKKIDSIINLPLIHNSIVRTLLADLFSLNVRVEVTETLHAIANMVFILTVKQQKKGKLKDDPRGVIINAIVDNYKDKNFNLDKLSSIALMSRRKVQYIISEIGETFTSLINKTRVEEMKEIINENPRILLSELTDMVGMKNSYAASKVFYKHEGVSIKEYRAMCRVSIK